MQLLSCRLQSGKSFDYQLKVQSHPRNPPSDSFLIWIWAWVLSCFLSISAVVLHPLSVTGPLHSSLKSLPDLIQQLPWLVQRVPFLWDEKSCSKENACPLGKSNLCFCFVPDLLKGRREKRKCVYQWCSKFVPLETRDPAWTNRSTSLAWKDRVQKQPSKTHISSAAFLFQCIRVFWQMLFLMKQNERNLWLSVWEIHFIWHLWKRNILGYYK